MGDYKSRFFSFVEGGQKAQRAVDAVIATHSRDPASSHRAEERITRGGRRRRHAIKVLGRVQLHPGWTATAIGQDLAGDPDFSTESHERIYQVRRRLSDLKNLGAIRQQRVKGCREVLWFTVEGT